MKWRTTLTNRLGLMHPIIQAPMGGATTPELVAAVCEAGGLGCVAAAYYDPEQINAACLRVRQLTDKPFGINLFAPAPVPALNQTQIDRAIARLQSYHDELGLLAPQLPEQACIPFDAQLAAVLDCGASVFSFTFGIPPAADLAAVKTQGMYVMGTATTVAEAKALADAGVDAIIAQGSEAGAHRGSFLGNFEDALIGTMALVPQIVDALPLPVIASGGIMDGRGLLAALALGASAVQMGTAFLTCSETGIAQAYKQAILNATEDATTLTRAFSGRPARGIVNRMIREVEHPDARDDILPYPWQNALTRKLRNAAAQAEQADYLSLWAGQGLGLAKRQSAAQLIARLLQESSAVLQNINALAIE
jgi:nitronate monooxygenase